MDAGGRTSHATASTSSSTRFPASLASRARKNTGSAMPPRSKIEQLPDDVRAELDRKLIEDGFRNYVELAQWLTDRGHASGKSAVGAYGECREGHPSDHAGELCVQQAVAASRGQGGASRR